MNISLQSGDTHSHEYYSVIWVHTNTHSEEYKILLVAFSHTVVHPGAMVVHLPDAALTHADIRERVHTHTHIGTE